MSTGEVIDPAMLRLFGGLLGVWLVALTITEPWAGIYVAFFGAPIAAGWYVYTRA